MIFVYLAIRLRPYDLLFVKCLQESGRMGLTDLKVAHHRSSTRAGSAQGPTSVDYNLQECAS